MKYLARRKMADYCMLFTEQTFSPDSPHPQFRLDQKWILSHFCRNFSVWTLVVSEHENKELLICVTSPWHHLLNFIIQPGCTGLPSSSISSYSLAAYHLRWDNKYNSLYNFQKRLLLSFISRFLCHLCIGSCITPTRTISPAQPHSQSVKLYFSPKK